MKFSTIYTFAASLGFARALPIYYQASFDVSAFHVSTPVHFYHYSSRESLTDSTGDITSMYARSVRMDTHHWPILPFSD